MKPKRTPLIDPNALGKVSEGRTIANFKKGERIFSQGDQANAVFYVQEGKVKLTVLSKQAKEAVIAILATGDFFGEGCLAGQPLRMATAAAISGCRIMRLEKQGMIKALHEHQAFSEMLLSYLLSRNIRIEEDLVDQLFNSSEKRLARVLLMLSNIGKSDVPEPVIPKISQETLAQIVGTTRSRVSSFMNKFRTLGLIEYNGKLVVRRSLLSIVLRD